MAQITIRYNCHKTVLKINGIEFKKSIFTVIKGIDRAGVEKKINAADTENNYLVL